MPNDAQSSHRRLYWIALLLVMLAAVGLRLWRIDSLPPGFHFDESFEGLEAWRILTDSTYHPIFLTGNFGVPPLNAYANAGMFWLFERFGGRAGPIAMRVTAAVIGVLGVLAVYALAGELRRLDPRRLTPVFPLLAAAALALMRWHIHFSRMGIEPVMVPAIWAGATWLFLRGWRTGSWLSFTASGVLLAAAMYAYQAAWEIPFLMIGVVGHLIIVERKKLKIKNSQSTIKNSESNATKPRHPIFNLQSSISPARWRGILLTALTAAILFAPLAWFFIHNLDLVFLRPTQLAVVGETGSPADSSVWANVWATAKMFGPFGQPGDLDPRRNLPGAPALNLWLAIPFYAGLLIALWRVASPAYSIPLIGLVGLLLPGVFSEYAPHFHRIVGAAAPAALLIGVGLDAVWRWGRETKKPGFSPKPGFSTGLAAAVIAGLLILGGATSARNYFVRWAGLPDLFYAFDAGIWELGQWTASLARHDPVYITPRGEEHATLAFAWRLLEPDQRPVPFDGRHIFPLTEEATEQPQQYAVIEHEDFRTRLLLPEVLPGAAIAGQIEDDLSEVYARIYTRLPGSEAARPPMTPRQISIGDGLRLAGYDAQPAQVRAGEILYVQLHWLADQAPSADWTVFIHLVDPASGEVVAGFDSRPGAGSLPTGRWRPGWRVLDEYQVPLPSDLPPGDYGLRMGLYQLDGPRLPADDAGFELGLVTIQ